MGSSLLRGWLVVICIQAFPSHQGSDSERYVVLERFVRKVVAFHEEILIRKYSSTTEITSCTNSLSFEV